MPTGALGSSQEPRNPGAHRSAQDRFLEPARYDYLSTSQKSNVGPANASGGVRQVLGGREGPHAHPRANECSLFTVICISRNFRRGFRPVPGFRRPHSPERRSRRHRRNIASGTGKCRARVETGRKMRRPPPGGSGPSHQTLEGVSRYRVQLLGGGSLATAAVSCPHIIP